MVFFAVFFVILHPKFKCNENYWIEMAYVTEDKI